MKLLSKAFRRAIALPLAIALMVPLVPGHRAFAHHATSMYDQAQTLTLDVVVVSWQMKNPHSELVVKDPKTARTLTLESGAVAILFRFGMRQNSFKSGQKLKVEYHPRLDKQPGGLLTAATLEDGTRFGR